VKTWLVGTHSSFDFDFCVAVLVSRLFERNPQDLPAHGHAAPRFSLNVFRDGVDGAVPLRLEIAEEEAHLGV
jgi:hypothetical protein